MAENGRLPASELAPIPGGRLEKAAAASWLRLRARVGKANRLWICPTSSRTAYRTLDEQQYFWDLYQSGKGNLAARPGTSNHGWGLAVDVATTAMAEAINRLGAEHGWQKHWSDAPSEWWHFKYAAEHDQHKDEPAAVKRDGFDCLRPDEKQMRRELMRLRREARAKGGFGNAPELKPKIAALRKQIMARRAEIKRNADRDGWQKLDRRQRYDLLGKVLSG